VYLCFCFMISRSTVGHCWQMSVLLLGLGALIVALAQSTITLQIVSALVSCNLCDSYSYFIGFFAGFFSLSTT
jgi:hypothetical protein